MKDGEPTVKKEDGRYAISMEQVTAKWGRDDEHPNKSFDFLGYRFKPRKASTKYVGTGGRHLSKLKKTGKSRMTGGLSPYGSVRG